MNDKILLKKLLEQCKKGKFKDSLELIRDNENCGGVLDQSSGIKLIISCCNVCVKNPEFISEENLHKFLHFVVSTIRNPSETELLSYIQSIYHIMNMFISKRSYNIIGEMENILLPSFLPTVIPKKHKDNYRSIVIILYNLVAKCQEQNDTNQNEKLITISTLILKISSTILGPIELINMSYKCFSNLVRLKIPVDTQKKYYEDMLLLVDSDNIQPRLEECFKYILEFSSIILNNILKTYDFNQAREFCDSISSLMKNKLFHEEYVHLATLLKSSLVISPVKLDDKLQDLVESCESMKILDEIWKESEISPQIKQKLMMLIQTVTYYYKSQNPKEWIHVSEILQLDILTFIVNISNNNFLHMHLILGLMEIYVQFKSDSSSDYHRKCLQIFESSINSIRHLKYQHCEEWKKAWNMLGIGVYNIGVHLNRNSNEGALLYFNFLLRCYISLECKNTKTILKHPTLPNCLRFLCELHLNDPKKYLGFTALAILLCPDYRESFITGWLKLKHSLRENKSPGFEEIQKITIVSALEMWQENSGQLVEGLNNSDKLNLFRFELEQYKKKWKSKVPIMTVVQEMCELSDLDGVVEVIVDIFGDHVLQLHENCLESFSKVLLEFENKVKYSENMILQVRLAILYHIFYKYNMRQIITKNALDMEWTSIVPMKLPSGLVPRDPSEECDVISSYESLTLEKFLCNLNNLDEALMILSKVSHELKTKENLDCLCAVNLYDRLIQISYEYRLLRHRIRSLQASEMALKIAEIQHNSAGIVQASSFVIEFADASKPYPMRQMEIVDKLLESTDFSIEHHLKIVLIYYICKSKALINIDIQQSYKTFQMAMDLMDSQEGKEGFSVIKSQLHLLKFKFSILPCDLEMEIHRKNTLMDVYSATAIMFDEYKKNHFDNTQTNEREYEISIMLDASEELSRLYHLMKAPMEVRTYGRETFLLTQKLVLPLRCSFYLMYLAHADIMSNRLEDCQVKIDGLANILSIRKSAKSKITQGTQKCRSPRPVKECNDDSMEMILDLPVRDQCMRQLSPSSPRLVVQSFSQPMVTKHKKTCYCFYCICFEYQTLVVEQTRLSALLSVKHNNLAIAQSFYEGALKIYDHYNEKWAVNADTVAQFVHRDLLPDYEKEFVSCYGYTLLNYSSHLRRTKSKTDALNTNNKLISALATFKHDHALLYNEAILQKVGFLTETLSGDPLQEIQNDMEFLSVNDTEEPPKTPDSKQTQISFPVKAITPNFSPPKKPIKKCLLFTLSPDNSTDNFGVSSKSLAQNSNLKTPGPKIQIYTDNSERKTRQKKTQRSNSVKAGPSEEHVTTADCDAEVKNVLRTRTKLLTEKLKQSSKKCAASDSKSEGKTLLKVPSSTRLPVRKNLLRDLASSDSEPSTSQNGAVRKSTRKKN